MPWVMFAVAVIGGLAGLAAVVIFVVTPWIQDSDAKGILATVSAQQESASNTNGGYSELENLPSEGVFQSANVIPLDTDGLGYRDTYGTDLTGNLLGTINASGSCYLTVILSESGRTFYSTSSTVEPERFFTNNSTSDCGDVVALADVFNPQRPVVEGMELNSGFVGERYTDVIDVSSYSDHVLEVTKESLPRGLTLNSNTGVISGTPTEVDKPTFEVTATNTGGDETAEYTIDILRSTAIFDTETLNSGMVGELYEDTLELTSMTDYELNVTAAALPAGLVLDSLTGVISGTPTAIEKPTFELTATNTGGDSAAEYEIDIVKRTVMTTSWDTRLPGCATIKLPLSGSPDGTISWNGAEPVILSALPSNTFTDAPGPKVVKIIGTFSSWGAASTTWSARCLTAVTEWKFTETPSLANAFNGATNLTAVAETPAGVRNMSGMFSNATSFNGALTGLNTMSATNMSDMFSGAARFNQPVGFFTGNVTTMSGMFANATAFNQPLVLNTGRVTDMGSMFSGASRFSNEVRFVTNNVSNMASMFSGAFAFNQPVNFNTGNVTIMADMFSGARSFNQPVSFNTAAVTSMASMFSGASAFNRPVVFSTGNVTSMANMFQSASAFNQVVNFSTGNVTNMSGMFTSARAFNQPVPFSTGRVGTMASMFAGAVAFNQPVSFNTAAVTNMSAMFSGASAFNSAVNLSTGNVTNMSSMFQSAVAFNQPVPFSTGNVSTMNAMFAGARSFTQTVPFSTVSVNNMGSMFSGASRFNQPVSFATGNVTDMSSMFAGAAAFNQPVAFNTARVTTMASMFNGARIFNQSLGSFSTSNVRDMSYMFSTALAFNNPVAGFDTSSVSNMRNMFSTTNAFNQPLAAFNTANVTDMTSMFLYGYRFNQDITGWDVNNVSSWGGFRTVSALATENTPVKFR
jgi:hypothetical protein